MLPIATSLRVRITPRATYTIIGANALIHLFLTRNTNFTLTDKLSHAFGFVPAYILNLNPTALPTLLTSMFLHGDLMHLIGNMLFLLVFGRKVENQLERKNYIAFYLACGLTASMTHTMIDPTSRIPVIGASGAISGVLGSFLIYNPKARITLLPDPILLYFMARYFHRIVIRIPAWVFLPIWFLIQLSMGMEPQRSGVAFWAHVGGFLAGAVMAIAVYKCIPGEKFHPIR